MRLRAGFVANSSSCGFIIPLAWITPEQLEKVQEMLTDNWETERCKKWGLPHRALCTDVDCWLVWITTKGDGRDCLCGSTDMDNGELAKAFERIGITKEMVIFQHETHLEWGGEGVPK